MRAYVIRRLLLLIPTVLMVTVIVFLTVRLIPGDVVDTMLGEMGPETGAALDREQIEAALGLDQPVHVQYGRWLRDIVTKGSFGVSMRGKYEVTEKILNRLPVTFELGLLALIVGLVVALPIGIYSAIRQDTIGDYVGRSVAIIFMSVPSFWTGTMIMIFPSIW